MRWALLQENYSYEIVHRSYSQMCHVDVLSRVGGILILPESNLTQQLSTPIKHEQWDFVLKDTEFTVNNTNSYDYVNRTINISPSTALFSINQRNENDEIESYIESINKKGSLYD